MIIIRSFFSNLLLVSIFQPSENSGMEINDVAEILADNLLEVANGKRARAIMTVNGSMCRYN